MALILKDRVQETSTTTGTGTLTLAGAVTQFQTFSSAVGNGNTTYYTIYNAGGTEWEVGIGTVGAGTLARTTVLASSNAGAAVNFTGTLYVFGDYPASKSVNQDANGALLSGGNAYVDFATASPTLAAGRMWYNNSTGNWNLGMGGGNITQQIGEELFVYGKASAAITDSPLQIVYHTGTVGASGVITFAPTIAGITDENAIVGVATENIALNGFGRVTAFGVVNGITTNGTAFGETWADDDVIWYNPVTGNPTKVKPVAPNIKFQIGNVIKAGSGGSGSFQVSLVQGTALGGTDSNVQITSVTNGNILTYDGGNGYWKNTDLAAGTGISVSKSTNGVLTVTNTSPSSGGTVTSVTGTAPVVSSGGTTPAISMPAATGSVNGYLTSTDWNTFNNKGSGSVTSVGGTGTVNGITLTGTVTSSGSLTLGGTLSNVSLSTQVTGTLPIANGGTGQTTAAAAFNALSPMTTTGDITYEASASTAARLPIGTAGQVLTVTAGIPAWSTPAGGGSQAFVAFGSNGGF